MATPRFYEEKEKEIKQKLFTEKFKPWGRIKLLQLHDKLIEEKEKFMSWVN